MTDETARDQLLSCLVYLTGHYGRRKSPESLVAGLPYTDQGMTVALFKDAANLVNFRTKIVTRSINDIPKEVLPAVLFL